MPIAARILLSLWTLPNTALGLFVGSVLTLGWPRLEKSRACLVYGSGRGVSGFVHRRGPSATTFGQVVVFWDPDVSRSPEYLDHEAVHVRQYLLLGPFFLPIYLAFLPFTGWRERHPLEAPAYRRATPKEE